MKPTAFPYIRPNTSVYIKANTTPAIKKDIIGMVLHESVVPQETKNEALRSNSSAATTVVQQVVYVRSGATLFCIAEPVFQANVLNGNIRVYG